MLFPVAGGEAALEEKVDELCAKAIAAVKAGANILILTDRGVDKDWAAMPSLLDTNTAYQLATQWLAAVSVDVGELEKKYRPLSVQTTINGEPNSWETRPTNSNQPHQKNSPFLM